MGEEDGVVRLQVLLVLSARVFLGPRLSSGSGLGKDLQVHDFDGNRNGG